MKTKAYILAWLLAAGFIALPAQEEYRKLSLTLHTDPHLGWFHADEQNLTSGPVRMGIGGGLRLDYQFQRLYAFSLGVNLNQTGGNIIYNNPLILDLASGHDTLASGTRVTYRLRYVEIPVALKLVLPEIGYSTWFLEAGLDPMINIKSLIDATDNNIHKVPFGQGVSKFNLAWHIGPGLKYSLGGRVSLFFALVYQNTFLDVTAEGEIRKPDNTRINQVGLKMGFVF